MNDVKVYGIDVPTYMDDNICRNFNCYPLSSRKLNSQPIIVFGDENKGLGTAFGEGKIDKFAVFQIIYCNGKGYVYYPYDYEWLEVFEFVSKTVGKDNVLSVLNKLMELSVLRNEVRESDFDKILDILEPYRMDVSVYHTFVYWSLWFFYACVAEEQYVRNGRRTYLGGLVKLVAFIEYVYEGYSIQDACDHYKGNLYYSKYNGSGSIVKAIKEKCFEYGVVRNA